MPTAISTGICPLRRATEYHPYFNLYTAPETTGFSPAGDSSLTGVGPVARRRQYLTILPN
jgi:hypothetical protein